MKRFSLIIVSAVLAVALMFGSLAINQTNPAHAATITTNVPRAATPPSTSIGTPPWVIKANPYVHVVNYIATIDPAINHALSSTELALVTKSVQHYNALPISAKIPTQIKVNTHVVNRNIAANASCPSGSGAIYGPFNYWWGFALTLDHCLVSQLWLVVAIDGSVAAGAALICGLLSAGLCAFFMGAIGLAIGAYVGALMGADGQCGNRGANLNFPAAAPPFVNAVC